MSSAKEAMARAMDRLALLSASGRIRVYDKVLREELQRIAQVDAIKWCEQQAERIMAVSAANGDEEVNRLASDIAINLALLSHDPGAPHV
jgi:hypothetical protein